MRPKHLANLLNLAIRNNQNVMVTGGPGTGKSDVVAQACGFDSSDAVIDAIAEYEGGEVEGRKSDFDLIISHPVVSDPVDYKGFPAIIDGKATFLPFSDLEYLISPRRKTVFFLDDMGQAPSSVQAAAMQLIQCKRINGHRVHKDVVFFTATNRKQDKAGVGSVIEPFKGRNLIIELTPDEDDWAGWAYQHGMPAWLIGLVKWKRSVNESMLYDFKPSMDMTNSITPRNVARAGTWFNIGIPEGQQHEVFSGCAGEAFAIVAISYLELYSKLPDLDDIINNPLKIKVPTEPGLLYAVCSALAVKATMENIDNIGQFIERCPVEFQAMTVKDVIQKERIIIQSKFFKSWSNKNSSLL
jgi:hypothetical protein